MTRVLVADDEPQILRALRINLRVRNYEVDTAATGSEALTTAGRHPPDLVLLDLGLPDLDGLQVIAAVRAFSAVPILVISARDAAAAEARARAAGADGYLAKPFEIGELVGRVRAALPSRQPGCGTSGDGRQTEK